MAGPNDFTGQNIQDTYQKVLQVSSSGQITDGTGSALPITVRDNDIIVPGAIHAQSYIISESLTVVTSGSTVFGDSSNDKHIFTGSLTTTGGISASAGIVLDNNTILQSKNAAGNVKDLAYISNGNVTQLADQSLYTYLYGSSIQLYATNDIILNPMGTYVHFRAGGVMNAVSINTTNGHISASGNISASTLSIPANKALSLGPAVIHYESASDTIYLGAGPGIVVERNGYFGSDLHVNMSITGSDISSSRGLWGKNLLVSNRSEFDGAITASSVFSQSDIGHGENIFGGDLTVHGRFRALGSEVDIMSGSVTASVGLLAPGFTASHKLLQLGSADDTKQELIVYGKIQQKGSDLTIMSGSITASANISTSATVQALTGSFGTNTTTITDRIETTGYITTTTGLQAPGFTASNKLLQLGDADNTKQELVVYGKIRQVGSGLTIMSGSITASADISMSGNSTLITTTGSFNHIITDGDTIEFRNASTKAVEGKLKFNTTDGLVVRNSGDSDTTNFKAKQVSAASLIAESIESQTSITASIISASSTIMTSGKLSTTNALMAPGFTASTGLLQLGAADNTKQELIVYGKIQQKGSDLTIMSGSLTASADISTSAGIVALSGSFGTGTTTITDRIVTSGDIAATNLIASTTGIQAPGFTASHKLLQLGSADDTKQELIVYGKIEQKGSGLTIMSGSLTASSDISTSAAIQASTGSFGTNTTTITDRIVTSGDIAATNIIASTTGLQAPGFTASHKLLQLGSDGDTKQELIVHGTIRQKGSDLTIMSGSITASGDISSSATIAGLTGSFGTGTTTITDIIHTTGTISGSGILTSGTITAVGNIESDAEVAATTVSAGTGGVDSKGNVTSQGIIATTTALQAPGFTASAKLLQLGAADNTKQELIVHGRLQVKGSDFTIMSGSITASGDISASGNISSGVGATGSFDHIITSQNTIEFRNPSTKSAVGFVSFDATNGLQPLNASFAALPRLADKIATARKVGGVSFDGSADIVPTGYKGSVTSMPFVGTDFLTLSSGDQASSLKPNTKISPVAVIPSAAGAFILNRILPVGLTPSGICVFGEEGLTYRVYASFIPVSSKFGDLKDKFVAIDKATKGIAVGTEVGATTIKNGIADSLGVNWDSTKHMISIIVTAKDAKSSILGGYISLKQ